MTTTVDEYFHNLNQMTPDEKDEHLRKDYYVIDQAWPDYLDFLEEWEDNYFSKLARTRKDFIFQYYAKRNQKLPCTCGHTHMFTTHLTSDNPQHTVCIPTSDSELDYTSCWYAMFVSADKDLAVEDTHRQGPCLSLSESEILRKLTALRMTLDGQPPSKLSFNDFMKVWWNKPGSSAAWQIFNNEFTPVNQIAAETKKQLPMKQAPWLSMQPTHRTENVMSSSKVSEFHGLHALLRSRQDRFIILEVMNSVRIDDPITINQLTDAISQCIQCTQYRNFPVSPSPVGVYYSPPGNGKTTSQRREFFVGIDTDWLTKEDFFDRECAPFLRMNLPIVTNQYHLAQHAGQKFIGTFNIAHLRTDQTGIPYTSELEINRATEFLSRDLFILLYDIQNRYFADDLVKLYRATYIYDRTRQSFFHKPPPSVKPIEVEKKAISSTDLISILTKGLSSGMGIKHRRRTKARRHM